MTRARLLLVEDDQALIELLRWHFEREGFEVVQTADGEEALMLADERAPDVVILDWMIEGIPGIEVCRRLRRRPGTANVPILMLTARGEEAARVRGLETGAHRVRRGGTAIPLGPTEFRLLRHFLEHPRHVFSRERLIAAVWEHDSEIDSRTVDVHIRRLRKAMSGTGPDLIRTVRSAGYSLDSDGD